MPKTKISEFSSTPASNTDIDSINIAEGCAPSGINDAIRELMAQLKDFQTGAVGDSFNGPVGTTTAAAGAFTTLAASGAVTLSGGTANGVTYLNGSKVVTSGSALTFDGTTFVAPITSLSGNGVVLTVDRTGTGGNDRTNVQFSNSGTVRGGIGTVGAADGIYFNQGTTEGMRLTSTGLGIGTSSPAAPLTVNKTGYAYSGNAYLTGIFVDGSGNKGVALGYDNTSQTGIIYPYTTSAASSLSFWTYPGSGSITERMRLDSAGNLGLGVTPSAWFSSAKVIQNSGGSLYTLNGNQLRISANSYQNTSNASTYYSTNYATEYRQNEAAGTHSWHIAASGTAGNAITFTQAMTLDASGNLGLGVTPFANSLGKSLDLAGGAGLFGYSNNSYLTANLYYDGAWKYKATGFGALFEMTGADGLMKFSRVASGSAGASATLLESMRIDASGNLLVGTTSAGGYKFVVTTAGGNYAANFNTGSGGVGLTIGNSSSGTQSFQYFYSAGTLVGSISTNGTTTSYNVTSDQRLKENIQDSDSASSLIDSLQVRKFDWKSDNSHQRYGFVAQELVTVAPEAVHQPTNTEDMMAVDYSKLVPMLVKEIQSLRKRLADAGI